MKCFLNVKVKTAIKSVSIYLKYPYDTLLRAAQYILQLNIRSVPRKPAFDSTVEGIYGWLLRDAEGLATKRLKRKEMYPAPWCGNPCASANDAKLL